VLSQTKLKHRHRLLTRWTDSPTHMVAMALLLQQCLGVGTISSLLTMLVSFNHSSCSSLLIVLVSTVKCVRVRLDILGSMPQSLDNRTQSHKLHKAQARLRTCQETSVHQQLLPR